MSKRLPRWGLSDYRKAFKGLKSLTDIRVDWRNVTPSQKRQIRIYDRERKSLEARGVKVFRAKGKNLASAQRYAQHEKGFPRFKVAFVPVASQGAKIKVKRGKVTVSEGALQRRVHQFADYEKRPGERWTNVEAVIKRILARDRKSVRFVRVCGKHEDAASYTRDLGLLVEACLAYQNQYGNAAKWFDGLIGYAFSAQADYNEYRASRKLAAEKKKRKRRAAPRNTRENER